MAFDHFPAYWKCAGTELGIPEEAARKVFEAARNLTRNQMLIVAREMITRPKTHPTEAILDGLRYAGIDVPPGNTIEEIRQDAAEQARWLFEKTDPCP
jgi:hypothetical protein